jgi:hypothetical protein
MRYRPVLYHSQKADPVDVIVFRKTGFQQPWFLRVPPDSDSWQPTEEVVCLYRPRMRIEHCFRDWKSHMGLRGLQLQVQKPERIMRLMMGFTLAYLILLLLGQNPLTEKLRPYFEKPRRRDHHGTPKILSVLSMALFLLSDHAGNNGPENAGYKFFLISRPAAASLTFLPSLPKNPGSL